MPKSWPTLIKNIYENMPAQGKGKRIDSPMATDFVKCSLLHIRCVTAESILVAQVPPLVSTHCFIFSCVRAAPKSPVTAIVNRLNGFFMSAAAARDVTNVESIAVSSTA